MPSKWHAWLGIALGLLFPLRTLATPVSGSSDEVLPGRPTGQARAVAPEDTSDFCSSVYLKTGYLTTFSILRIASTAPSQLVTIGDDTAGAASYADVESYLAYDDRVVSPTAHTGSLRWLLWAVPQNQVVGWPKVNGYLLGGFVPSLIDGQGQAHDYLPNLTEVTLRGRVSIVNPPAGRYCLTVAVDMYGADNLCGSTDGYCPEDAYTLKPVHTFR